MKFGNKKRIGVTAVVFVIVCVISFIAIFERVAGTNQQRNDNYLMNTFAAETGNVFEPVLPDQPVILPDDFAFHNEYQNEWWNFFANVVDKEGNKYGIQWNYFRIASSDNDLPGWLSPQLYIAHLVVSTEDTVLKEQRVARGGIGQAGMTNRPFRIWLDNWNWRSLGRTPFPGRLDAETDSFSVNLNAITAGPFVLPGERGYVAKHDLLPLASHNITAPFLDVSGTLELAPSKRVDVAGSGWMSKEWGSDLLTVGSQRSDWFVLELDGETTLSLSRYRHPHRQPYEFGTLSTSDGKVITLTEEQVSIVPLLPSTLSNRKRIPLQWSINIPDYQISLTTQVLNRDLWLPFAIQYWQGPIQTTGSHQARGFMQLGGY